MTADTTPAAEALARALLANEFDVVEDEAENARRAAAALLAHPFADLERAALVAALLDGHEAVLAGALDRVLTPDHRDDLPCGCDDCMSYGAEDIGADWARVSAAGRIAMRVMDSGDERLGWMAQAFRAHESASGVGAVLAALPSGMPNVPSVSVSLRDGRYTATTVVGTRDGHPSGVAHYERLSGFGSSADAALDDLGEQVAARASLAGEEPTDG